MRSAPARRHHARPAHPPVLKFRYAAVATLVVACAVIAPLLAVGKQVYMRDLAMKREQLADSLYTCNREIGTLVLRTQALTSAPRIEQIARERLNMDYPSSDQIVILESRSGTRARHASAAGILAILRRSFGQNRG